MSQRRGQGKKLIHFGYSWLAKGILPPEKMHIRNFLEKTRENIESHYDSDISEPMAIVLDKLIEKLGYLALINEAVWKENQAIIIDKDGIKLNPVIEKNYLRFADSTKHDLVTLEQMSKDRKKPEGETLEAVIKDLKR